MKQKISDMLDAYSGAELNLETQTPLSSERIRELTMSKIENKKNKPRRIAFRVLAAAAIIAALVVSAVAAGTGAEWFKGFFSKQGEAELSDGQIRFIDGNAIDLNQSQTIDGYTVTLESYISDGAKAYLKFKIQAPEGKELPKVLFEWMKPYKNGELIWDGVSSVWGRLDSGEEKGIGLYLLTMDGIPLEGDGLVLSLIDLHEYDGAGQLITEGSWNFELESPDTRVIELIEEPLAGVLCKTPEGEEFEVTVTSACLRAMSLKVTYEDSVNYASDHRFDAVKVIMKDGSSMTLNWSGGRQYTNDEGIHLSADFDAEAPLELDEVAWIEFPGGIQIPETEKMELVDEPVTRIEAINEENECVEVELVSAQMTSMGLQIEFDMPYSESSSVYYFFGVKAVMQDGTEVLLREKSFGNHDTDEGNIRWIYFEPQSPTPLDEVQYIEFPGGVQIPVSEE